MDGRSRYRGDSCSSPPALQPPCHGNLGSVCPHPLVPTIRAAFRQDAAAPVGSGQRVPVGWPRCPAAPVTGMSVMATVPINKSKWVYKGISPAHSLKVKYILGSR